ncbi:MAG: ATP-binding cassette domain-containing protein [Candidatus Limnocylindrales bacterium]|nr:ATP-binding cassette domain-containing protein [Candidatus Limnocylindrales bacterium]
MDVELDPGDCLLLVGPSGSGKSTFGLALAGLIPREIPGVVAGSLTVDDRETAAFEPAELAAAVGLVFQDPAVQLVMDRVEDDVAFGLENRGWPRRRMQARVPEVLAAVGLAGFERRHARELSGGEQQRLALAGVLAAEPGILVLDEPTANLDPAGATAFLERLADIRARRAATIVLVEHRVEAAWPLADLVLALGPDGTPIAAGTPDAVLREAGPRMAAAGIWLPEAAGPPAVVAGPSAPEPIGRQILEARDLRFGYDRLAPVLRDVDFVAAEGERIALVGPNGGGKSTLGRLLVGLLRPQRGIVRLDGQDPARLPPASLARLGGYVFQRPEEQFLAQRVIDEVTLGLRSDELDEAARLMDRLGLPLGTFEERSPYRLSGGEQRRLSLACALVRRPSVLILDEPTFGQDRRGYEALLAILRDMVAEGACLIAATHDPRFVRDVAGRIVTLDDGWLVGDEPAPGARAPEMPA